jgi:LSD1 subclass zinc finger protein
LAAPGLTPHKSHLHQGKTNMLCRHCKYPVGSISLRCGVCRTKTLFYPIAITFLILAALTFVLTARV